MKCFIHPEQRFNKKQLEAMKEYGEQCAKNSCHEREQERSRRLYKLWCVALNALFGFGKRRIGKLILYIEGLAEEFKSDELFWRHIDNIVIDQMGLDFSRENYDELED